MELNTLQKRINERAEAKFQSMMNDLVKVMNAYPILLKLKITTQAGEKPLLSELNDGIVGRNRNGKWMDTTPLLQCTNFLLVKEEMIADLVQQETDELLAQIDSIKDIINDDLQD